MNQMEEIFKKVDVIVTPTSANGTFKITETDSKCKQF